MICLPYHSIYQNYYAPAFVSFNFWVFDADTIFYVWCHDVCYNEESEPTCECEPSAAGCVVAIAE